MPDDFARLLDARSALLRQAAVLRIDDAVLTDDKVLAMAADRAPRVREAARFRARKRDLDVAAWYRNELRSELPANRMAAILDGLIAAGNEQDLPAFQAALLDPRPRVRAVALRGIAAWTTSAETIEQLKLMLTDPSGRVAASAARVLARVGASAAIADDAWASLLPGSRRAAWFITRSTGGWNAVEADLRLAADADVELAGLGRTQVSNWLTTRAATTWQPLAESQRSRIAGLLDSWDASIDLKRTLAFHAGIRPLPGQASPEAPVDVLVPLKRKWWRR
jgi:HEAT repeat protein